MKGMKEVTKRDLWLKTKTKTGDDNKVKTVIDSTGDTPTKNQIVYLVNNFVIKQEFHPKSLV